MRLKRDRKWLVLFACSGIAVAITWWLYAKSEAQPDQKAISSAEDEVYETLVRYMLSPKSGQFQISQLVFSDHTDQLSCAEVERQSCEQNVRKNFFWASGGTLRLETIEDFLKKYRMEGPLSTRFHTDLPRVFIDPNTVLFDFVPSRPDQRKDFRQLYPGASGIISLSPVGFDSRLNEAIVSSSFDCGMLCGTGRRYILRKKWGQWSVVDSWVVWVS